MKKLLKKLFMGVLSFIFIHLFHLISLLLTVEKHSTLFKQCYR